MAEVAELYESNIALQIENNMLKKQQEKLNKGIKILDSKENMHQDSMNVDSEMYEYEEESFVKNGSYTDNDELGKSHYIDDSIGSIHNIFIDPTSESYIKAKEREVKMKVKPKCVPTLDFEKLNLPHLQPSLKIKSKGKKGFKIVPANKVAHYSLSNRSADEKITFTGGNDESGTREAPEDAGKDHIMIQDVNELSYNLYDDSQQHISNFSKAQNSVFANSSNTTKKKTYIK